MTSNIRRVSSPSHPITFEFGEEPNQATVSLSQEYDISLAKDFEMSIVLAQPHQYALLYLNFVEFIFIYVSLSLFVSNRPCSRVQQDADGNKMVMVSVFPDLALDEDVDVQTEMIFVIDRSGSMAGSRMTQGNTINLSSRSILFYSVISIIWSNYKIIFTVKNTMQIFMRSLAQGVMFQILGFGTNTDPLFKKKGKGKDMYTDFSTTVAYNDSSLETATKHINSMKADLGG